MNNREWTTEMKQKIMKNPRTIFLFARNKDRDNHNLQSLKKINSSNNPVAIVKSITEGICGSRRYEHFDEARNPSKAHICVGSKVSLVGVNIKPEWGLYHGTIGKVIDIVYENSKGPHHEGTAQERLPEYVMVDFPQYCGPSMYANDKNITSEEREKRKTWVAVPMIESRCKNNM